MRKSHFVLFGLLLSACSASEGVETPDIASPTPPRGEQALGGAWDGAQAGTYDGMYNHGSHTHDKGKHDKHKKPKHRPDKHRPGEKDDATSIYGDGSAGARSFDAPNTILDEANLQFTDFTVQSGTTLFVNSGTVVRCTGTFRNDGTIVVRAAAATGVISVAGLLPNLVLAASTPPDPGISLGPAGNATVNAGFGGTGGAGVGAFARSILHPGVKAGGGAGGFNFIGLTGGGSFTVLCKKGVHNSGAIQANGNDGPGSAVGGGGGGVIILASKTEVTSTGDLHAIGGNGGNATIIPGEEAHGGGGGGGGGIVHLVSPSIEADASRVVVDGGQGGAGTADPVPLGVARIGGAGGGACAGNGGRGSQVNTGFPIVDAEDGTPGVFLRTLADPSDLF